MAKRRMKKPLDSSACSVLARGKKAWKNFEVIKVKLNPEQAVLTCCLGTGRGLDNMTCSQSRGGDNCGGQNDNTSSS